MKTELRAMTNSPETFERPVIRSSVTPSLKYSCDGSWLRFVNGKTATDGLSGRASPADSGVFSQRQLAQPAAPRSNVTATAAATPLANRARVLPALGDASEDGLGSRPRRYTRTGLAMVLTVCSPLNS